MDEGGEAEPFGGGPAGDQAGRGGVVLAAGVAGGDGRPGVGGAQDGLERGELSGGGVGTGVLVGVDEGLPLAGADRYGHRLVGEPAGGEGVGGAALGAEGQRVLVLAAHLVGAPQVLGGLDHAAGYRVVDAARLGAAAREGVVELEAGAEDAPAALVGVVGGGAHHVDAAGDDDLAETAADLQGGVDDGLEPGAAAPVDLHARHPVGQPRVEGGDAADGGGVAGRVGVTEDHLVDPFGVDTAPLDDGGDDVRGERGGSLPGQRPAEPADGGAQRRADDDVVGGRGGGRGCGHGRGLLRVRTGARAAPAPVRGGSGPRRPSHWRARDFQYSVTR
ncbi:hypothetical protein EES44_17835 [Streptomyces sp. ADI96-15]|nr:hypothetical protein EES44_17835 [Streptomyces sp. ADI96-15]